ncbi:MAG TPA: hypothetical protein DDW52_11950 [Planctomycetaceae bacterium]|nr:hypothetical protein [Planctomycetaceae bacterium]
MRQQTTQERRNGSTLIFVLIVLAMISYGVYCFSELTLAESRALRFSQDRIHALAAAHSGTDHILAQITNKRLGSTNNLQFHYEWANKDGHDYRFSIQPSASEQLLGLTNECSRLNLNSLDLSAASMLTSRRRLLALPGITQVAADSLLDWLDSDETPRKYGAEIDWYLAQNLPQRPRNGALDSLEELSLVRGFGRSLHRLLPYVTVLSAEANFNDRGGRKVNINQNTLARLYRSLEPVVGANGARFIVALRMNGPMQSDSAVRFNSIEATQQRRETAQARAVEQSTGSLQIIRTQPELVGGLTINRSPVYTIPSIAALLGRQTRAMIKGNQQIIESPWKGHPMTVSAELAQLESLLTVDEHDRAPGRINPSLAPKEVLRTVPGITDHLAKRIVDQQNRLQKQPESIGWMVRFELVDLKQLRQFSPYLTSGGDVYTGVSVGRYGVTDAAVHFELDCTTELPSVLRRAELEPGNYQANSKKRLNKGRKFLSVAEAPDR